MNTDVGAKPTELPGQFSRKTVESMTVWAEANQRMLRDLVDLTVGAANEGVRLYTELQQGAIEPAREGQATALRWQTSGQDRSKDPIQSYQETLVESVDGTQKFFRLLEGNAQTVTRAAERLQASAEQAVKGIQETFEATVTRMKGAYTQN